MTGRHWLSQIYELLDQVLHPKPEVSGLCPFCILSLANCDLNARTETKGEELYLSIIAQKA